MARVFAFRWFIIAKIYYTTVCSKANPTIVARDSNRFSRNTDSVIVLIPDTLYWTGRGNVTIYNNPIGKFIYSLFRETFVTRSTRTVRQYVF